MATEETIECTSIGPILHQDDDNRRFYEGFQIDSLSVHVGDCVRVQLEDKGADTVDAFAQVLAIFETSEEEMMVEVRWLSQTAELTPKLRQM